MIKNRYQVALLLSLFVILGLGFIAGQTGQQKPKPKPAEWSGDSMKGWQQYDQLVKEQKYEAASSLVEEMLAKRPFRKEQHRVDSLPHPLHAAPHGVARL